VWFLLFAARVAGCESEIIISSAAIKGNCFITLARSSFIAQREREKDEWPA
jgi:hypothetical protein